MAWAKKGAKAGVPTMTIKGAAGGRGLMSVTKAPGAGAGPGASLSMPHPNVQHLQEHVGTVFGAASGGANRAAHASGGKKPMRASAPKPAYQGIANGMLASGPGSAIGGG